MMGPEIKSGLKLDNAKIIDVAPTVLHLFGLPVPSYMDGRPLYEAIKLSQAEKSVKGPAETVEYAQSQESPYTPEEEEEIKRRLRRLGYIS